MQVARLSAYLPLHDRSVSSELFQCLRLSQARRVAVAVFSRIASVFLAIFRGEVSRNPRNDEGDLMVLSLVRHVRCRKTKHHPSSRASACICTARRGGPLWSGEFLESLKSADKLFFGPPAPVRLTRHFCEPCRGVQAGSVADRSGNVKTGDILLAIGMHGAELIPQRTLALAFRHDASRTLLCAEKSGRTAGSTTSECR